MTVKQLKAAIENLPDNMDIMLPIDDGEFSFQPLESAYVKRVRFYDDSNEDDILETWEDCLILDNDIV